MSQISNIRKILSTAGLLLVDAMVFQEVLARFDDRIRTLAKIRSFPNLKRALEKEWEKILEINYQPIFRIALNIIKELPASPQLNRGLRALLQVAEDIASSRVLLKHDLFGRIYHDLLLGKLAKYYATFYTSIPAARLLARLLINLPSTGNYGLRVDDIPPKWFDEEEEELLRVVDFACGSGTLLSAIYKEIMLKHRLEAENPKIKELHRVLLEEVLWGFDVLQHATHLASVTLFLHEPAQPVRFSRIYALKLGIFGRNRCLGSIDFLRDSRLLPHMLLFEETIAPISIRISAMEEGPEAVRIPIFHYCIMNPPFTRSVGGNLLFGALPKKERRELQQELRKILRTHNLTGIGQAGLGAVFVFLADNYLKRGGRIGLVLPKAVLNGVAWRIVREKLLTDYHIEYVISSFQGPNDWNFSENTSLSEVLLVARKLRSGETPGYTFFVSLWRKPVNEMEAISIGSQLTRIYNNPELFDIFNSNTTCFSITVRGGKIGEAWSARIDDVDFGYLISFAQAELNRITTLLRKGIVYLPKQGLVGHIPLTPLANLAKDIGPDVRQIHATYTKVALRSGMYKAFWGHESESIRAISQSPNAGLNPKTGKVAQARSLWSKSSRLLLVERAWLATYRVLSVLLDEPVLSNVWWPIIVASNEHEKILSVWFNSTYGILLLISIAEVTRGPWIKFKKANLWHLPVLNINKLNSDVKQKLLKLYDAICRDEFKPLPEEFSDPCAREKIDRTLNATLGIEVDMNELYEMLARDPTITGGRLS